MKRIELTHDDVRILAETLEIRVSDLRMEIAQTDSMDYREMLKRRKEGLLRVIEALREPALRD